MELPAELLIKILEYMTFKENSTVRLVCRRLNELCAARLNSTFNRLQNNMLVRFQTIKVSRIITASTSVQTLGYSSSYLLFLASCDHLISSSSPQPKFSHSCTFPLVTSPHLKLTLS